MANVETQIVHIEHDGYTITVASTPRTRGVGVGAAIRIPSDEFSQQTAINKAVGRSKSQKACVSPSKKAFNNVSLVNIGLDIAKRIKAGRRPYLAPTLKDPDNFKGW